MSCENGPNRVAKLAGQIGGGISQLAGKRSFYAGLAVGAGGAVGAQALVKAIRNRRQSRPQAIARPGSTGSGPGTRANPRKIPEAALQRPGSRANPRKIATGGRPGNRSKPKKIATQASGSRSKPRKIPVLSQTPAETKLQAAAIRMQTANGQPYTPKSSYRVVRPDGSDTGLAVTPYVREGENGPVEDDRRWGVTHTASGTLIGGPYDSVSRAQGLATQLSGLNWTASHMPAAAVNQARQIVQDYRREAEGETR